MTKWEKINRFFTNICLTEDGEPDTMTLNREMIMIVFGPEARCISCK